MSVCASVTQCLSDEWPTGMFFNISSLNMRQICCVLRNLKSVYPLVLQLTKCEQKWPWMGLWHVHVPLFKLISTHLSNIFETAFFPTHVARKIIKKTPNVDVVDHNGTELCLDKSNIGHQIESLICWSTIEAYPLEAFLAYQSYII